METSEVGTDQKDFYCNYCSGRDAILVYLYCNYSSGRDAILAYSDQKISPYPDNQQLQPPTSLSRFTP